MPKAKEKKYELKTNEHMEEYMGLMISWANKYTKRNLGEFDDMRQEVFMVYMRTCDTYNPNVGKFSTYLYTSLRNHMYRLLENKGREIQTVSLDNQLEEEQFIDLLESDYIFIDIDAPIIKMRYKGKTMTDIAKILGVSRTEAYRMLEEERKKF